MRIVVALGGNAILRRGEPMTVDNQRASIADACAPLASIADANELIITHGNGPQVGLLALQAEAFDPTSRYPFDVLGAQTEGMIGYLIGQELGNHLNHDRTVVTVITRTLVDADDPAFDHPTKPIGPIYGARESRLLSEKYGWCFRPDGDHYRRVVPSPMPRGVIELEAIRWILEKGGIVICAGGGGIPTTYDAVTDTMLGVEAVIDKDLTSATLAAELSAERMIIATDVDGVYDRWGSPDTRRIRHTSPEALSRLQFAAGSMGPKVDAAIQFAVAGGEAVIGRLDDIGEMLHGRAGTTISTAYSCLTYAD